MIKRLPEDFWKLNVGHVAVIVVWLVTVGVQWSRMETQLKDHDARLVYQSSVIEKILLRIEAIDRDGSTIFQRQIIRDKDTSVRILNKLDSLEGRQQTLALRLEAVSAGVEWLTKHHAARSQ